MIIWLLFQLSKMKKNIFNQNEFKYKKGSDENIQKNGKIENIKESEENDREPYRKLFQISDYLLHYKSKIENNKINIVNSFTKNENQKKNSNNTEINTKNKKDGKNDNNTNITINLLDNKNLFYLWYMEAKKRNNKSLNYKMGKNYDELFNDFI